MLVLMHARRKKEGVSQEVVGLDLLLPRRTLVVRQAVSRKGLRALVVLSDEIVEGRRCRVGIGGVDRCQVDGVISIGRGGVGGGRSALLLRFLVPGFRPGRRALWLVAGTRRRRG
jgi:hypothetical protein